MPMQAIPLPEQFIHLLASVVLLLSFAMLAQRRIRTLIHLFALQGAALVCSTLIVAWSSGQHHLYYSAALTLALKVIVLPLILYRLTDRLECAGTPRPACASPPRCWSAWCWWYSPSGSRSPYPASRAA
jgi:hydrogenase-4 component E